tara:strand:+ start:108 stop:584 length:477 start_codon:yes stop_codon:yes gene_type:complete
MNKLIVPLKHYSKRPKNTEINLAVIHYISAVNLDKEKWDDLGLILGIFGEYNLSTHYLIEQTGRIIELVHPDLKAWHAGKSKYNGKQNCNNFSVGIELVGGDFVDFDTKQYNSLNSLLKDLKKNYPIKNIVGHSDIATPKGRKKDPGSRFQWEQIKGV